MKEYNHEFNVQCEIGKVWDFFMDPKHIEVISTRDFNEILIKSSTTRLAQGTELWVSTDLFVKRHWHSKITKIEELREFVDEVQGQRYFKWIHTHRFSQLDSNQTRIIDDVIFQFGFA